MKVVHLLPGLGVGGAEMLLVRLLQSVLPDARSHEVIALGEHGPLTEQLAATGAHVTALGLPRNSIRPLALPALAAAIRGRQPAVLHTWMYHANLAGALLRPLLSEVPVIWSVHNARLSAHRSRRLTRLVNRACALVSPLARRIVYCSRTGRDVHEEQGYDRRRSVCIPNGFDTALFRPDAEARQTFRAELGLGSDALLVGHAARFDPDKDHQTFLRAAAIVRARLPRVRFLLCGAGTEKSNRALMGLIEATNLGSSVHLLGLRTDMPQVMASLDLLMLSSRSEAFPNVLGEAMACGIPCVSTRAGDAADILGSTGEVCEPGDPDALAEASLKVLQMPPADRREAGLKGRHRVSSLFDLRAIARQYAELWAAEGGC